MSNMFGIIRGACEARGISDDCIMPRWMEADAKVVKFPAPPAENVYPFGGEVGWRSGPPAEIITLCLLIKAT